jgi:MYXO-CTERM domain-containing protein
LILRSRWFALAFTITAAWSASSAEAGNLTFDGIGLATGDAIPGSYGDNLADTPHVTVEYRALDPDDLSTVHSYVSYWLGGPTDPGGWYPIGDLIGSAYGVDDGLLLEIKLVASSGYAVRLESFDIAGFPDTKGGNPSTVADPNWPAANWTGQTLWLVDGNGNTLSLDDDLTVLGYDTGTGLPTHMTFEPNTTSGSIAIRLGPSWNVGIDNIRFSEVSVTNVAHTPLPPAALLGAAGLGVAALLRRRRRAASV